VLLVDGTARITGPAGGTENPDLIKCDELTGLPEELDQLATLTTLNLSGVVELPAWVEQRTTWVSLGLPSFILALPSWVTRLAALDLSWCCSLTGLPESLGQLAALKPLNLIGCDELTGLPESLGQLVSLTTLNLESGSAFTGLPESLGQRGGVDDTASHRM
jgi:hypothetical protein